MKRWITARIGATTIVFSLFGVAKSAKVAKRRATVSLLGLSLSCGRVSQAGNSSTLLCNSRNSDAKSSALRLELVTTRIADFSTTLASKNGYVAAGAMIFFESCRQDATALSLLIICTNARICLPVLWWKLLLEKPFGPVPKKGGGLMLQV